MLTRRNFFILFVVLAMSAFLTTIAVAQDPTATPAVADESPLDTPAPPETDTDSAYLATLEAITNLAVVLGLGLTGAGIALTGGAAMLLRTLFSVLTLLASTTKTQADDELVKKLRQAILKDPPSNQ